MEEKADRLKLIGQWALLLIFAVLGGYFLATTVVLMLEGAYIVPPRLAVVKKAVVEKAKARTLDDYVASMKSIFPAPAQPQAGTGTGPGGQQAPAALGPMNLVATIIGDGTSVAVINVAKKDEVVSTGQTLGTYKVKSIFRNKVILEEGSQQVVLRMKFGEPDEPRPLPSPSQDVKSEPGVIKREYSRREFDAIAEHPDKVALEMGFAPVSRDGKAYGMQFTFIKPGSFFQTLGFQPGDIIASINNKSVYTTEEAFQAYQMMKNEDTADFKIDRGGRFIQLQVQFK
jgi:type II secretion system protein C